MNHNHYPDDGPMPSRSLSALRGRLLARVQRSHAHESQFLTVRRNAGAWNTEASGVRMKTLAQTGLAHSLLVELAPHAALAAVPGFTQAELVLLEGVAQVGDMALNCGDAACVPHDGAHALCVGPTGARLYLRLSAASEVPSRTVRFSTLIDDSTWDDFCPGVRIKALWDGGARRSVLVRMRAGASVNGHPHALEEECMMLGGEAFIGDTLLRSGEYQLAPRGSTHGEVTTDVGALFYVHGALDPAAYA